MALVFQVFQTISPVFVLIFIGFLSKKLKLLSDQSGKELNKFVFYIALPCLLAAKISQTNIDITDQKLPYISIIFATVCCALLGFFGALFLGMQAKQQWVVTHGSMRSNMAFIGLPIISFVAGDEVLAIAILLMGLTIPFYNIAGVFFLTMGAEREDSPTIRALSERITLSILKNPLIIGCFCGAVLYGFHLSNSHILIKNMDFIGTTSIHLSLISLGIQINADITWHRIKSVLLPTMIKLVAYPLLGLVFYCFIFKQNNPQTILALLVLLGCPSAVASYVMAVEMKADHKLAGDIVLASTMASLFSISGLLLFYYVLFPTT